MKEEKELDENQEEELLDEFHKSITEYIRTYVDYKIESEMVNIKEATNEFKTNIQKYENIRKMYNEQDDKRHSEYIKQTRNNYNLIAALCVIGCLLIFVMVMK